MSSILHLSSNLNVSANAGLIGTAPSQELLDIWNTREQALVDEGENAVTLGAVLHTRPLANLPTPQGACLGTV